MRLRRLAAWTTALAASVAFHAGAAILLLPGEAEVQIEGGASSEIALLGDGFVDLVSAGAPDVVAPTSETRPALEPVETVQAPAAPSQSATVEALEAAPSETRSAQSPATPPTAIPALEPIARAPAPQHDAAETATAQADEADPVKTEATQTGRPAPAETPANRAEPLPPVELSPIEEAIAMLEDVPLPTTRPAYTPPPPPVREAVRQRQQPRQQAQGNGGNAEADARRGAADGASDARAVPSSGAGQAAQAGNAAVSNYPGQVVTRLRRSLRYPPEARRQRLNGEVHVEFTVSSSGGVSGVRVARSSGHPALDQAAIATVQRAAPFPPIPEGAGRSQWPFTVPLAFSR